MSIKLRIGKNFQDFYTEDKDPANRFDGLVEVKSIAFASSLESKGTTLNFDLIFTTDYSDSFPQEGNEVHLYINDIRVFGGTLLTISRSLGSGGFNEFVYRCACVDFTFLLDRKLVNDIYDEATPPEMIYQILKHLDAFSVDAHYSAMLSGSGFIEYTPGHPKFDPKFGPTVTHNGYSTLGLDKDGNSIDSTIPKIKQQRLDRVRPSSAFTTICKAANMHWWIDEYKRINVKFTNQNPSPLAIKYQSILDVAKQIDTFFDWEEEGDVSGVGNKSILKDATIKEVIPRINTATHSSTDDQIDDWYRYVTDAKPFDHLSIISIIIFANKTAYDTINSVGTALEVKIDGFTIFNIPDSLENDQVGVRIGADTATIFIHESQLSDGNIIEIIYQSSYNDDYEGVDSDLVNRMKERTGGDGIHEFVIANIAALNVESTDALDEINATLLSVKAKVPQYRGKFSTYQLIHEEVNMINGLPVDDGMLGNLLWRPGQSFSRKLPQNPSFEESGGPLSIAIQILPVQPMYVIKVDTVILRAGGSIRSLIQAAGPINPNDQYDYYETILKHTITYSSVPTGLLV